MRIAVSAGGRFHAFNLAYELERCGYLKQLITSYPKWKTSAFKIPKDKVVSIFIKEVLERGYKKLPLAIRRLYDPQFFICEVFDRLAAKSLKQADICVVWPSFALHTITRAKKLGIITVAEGSSSHALYQYKILEEEYAKFNLDFPVVHKKVLQKELSEYKAADYIMAASKYVERTFLENGIPQDKILRIPYGVSLSSFRQVSKEDNIFRVIYCGAMSLRKGVHYLLQAFAELDLENAELMLIGGITDEIRPFFKKFAGKFKWVGIKPQSELYKYYSQGSLFVMPSIEEGLAMVQAQAMACGLPLLCTTNTGGEDLIREGTDGFVVPIRDVGALKEKILLMYENPLRCKEMGQSAKHRVKKEFSWQEYGQRIVSVYSKILEGTVAK
ncbi:MAG: glycosyltransferase family 4 protein [Candidatus Omnitrophota bacterium]